MTNNHNCTLKEIAALIQSGNAFNIIAHISPDGDTLGASLALCHTLREMGKTAQVVCSDPVPGAYAFLPGAAEVVAPEKAVHAEIAISVDCGDLFRLGNAYALFDAAKVTVNIDHHGSNPYFARFNYVLPQAAATAEIILALISEIGVPVSKQTADCLYTGIMTDTGCFSYSNTTPQTFRSAAILAECGADVVALNRAVYRTVKPAKSRLVGLSLSKVQLHHDGEIGAVCISQADLRSCGANSADIDGIVEQIRDISTVKVAFLLKEIDVGQYRISFRSKDAVDVAAIAARFDGGGHKAAAGGSISAASETQAMQQVLDAVKNDLEQG